MLASNAHTRTNSPIGQKNAKKSTKNIFDVWQKLMLLFMKHDLNVSYPKKYIIRSLVFTTEYYSLCKYKFLISQRFQTDEIRFALSVPGEE